MFLANLLFVLDPGSTPVLGPFAVCDSLSQSVNKARKGQKKNS